jgi:ribonuclease HII
MKISSSPASASLTEFDKRFRNKGILCGVDEAGRGPIAGPVVSAAVIFSEDVYIEGVRDSKKLSPARRQELYEKITESCMFWAIGVVDNKTIDEINILNATRKSMDIAISALSVRPDVIIVDGNFYDKENRQVINIVKADDLSFSVAAASIIAKVTRDRIMCDYELLYPFFSFSRHKGYCTSDHIEEIKEHGLTDIHRRSFRLKTLQGELF